MHIHLWITRTVYEFAVSFCVSCHVCVCFKWAVAGYCRWSAHQLTLIRVPFIFSLMSPCLCQIAVDVVACVSLPVSYVFVIVMFSNPGSSLLRLTTLRSRTSLSWPDLWTDNHHHHHLLSLRRDRVVHSVPVLLMPCSHYMILKRQAELCGSHYMTCSHWNLECSSC